MNELSLIQSIFLFQIVGYAILRIFFKPDIGRRLYCGVFAFNGPSDLSKALCHLVLNNIKILGMYNDDRGGDNAGIVINNEVLRTIGTEYKFKTLLERNHIEVLDPAISTIIIGHSRKGSVGGKGHENAHPFEIYEDKKNPSPDWYMTGVHNGTIENWQDLLKNHVLDEKEFKNDSKTMLKIIARQRKLKKVKKYNVLEKYKGNGVFIWYFRDEPDTMYVFKGAHKKYKTATKADEERPLFFYECPITQGIYFSSIKDSLIAISADRELVKDLATNTVFKFRQGKLVTKDSINIDREDVYEFESAASSSAYGYGDEEYMGYWEGGFGPAVRPGTQKQIGFKDYTEQNQHAMAKLAAKARAQELINKTLPSDSSSVCTVPVLPITSSIKREGKTIILGAEDVPLKNIANYKDKIYREHGLYKFGGELLNGEYIINMKTNEIHSSSKKNLLEQAHIFEARYFYEGYMLKSKAALIDLQELDKNDPKWKVDKAGYIMSKYCSYPVPTTDGKMYYLNLNKAQGYFEGIPYSEGKVYDYKDGKLIEVRKVVETTSQESSFPPQEIDYGPIVGPKTKIIDLHCPNYSRDNDRDITDPDGTTPTPPKLTEEQIADQLKKNQEEDSRQEELSVIDSLEQEILEGWHDLKEKIEEQMYNMDPFVKEGSLKKLDFLSGSLFDWGIDCIEGGVVGTPKDLSPHYKLDDKGKLTYTNVSKMRFF